MARRTVSRMEKRRIAEAAEAADEEDGTAKKKKKKKAKTTRARKTAKAKESTRMKVRWAVVNDGMKQVAVFDYAQKKDAEGKAKAMIDKGKGHHFVLPIKVPMPDEETAATE